MISLTGVIFWLVQASSLLVFAVPFRWSYLALWAASHFLRGMGLTLAYHRYFAHRAFKMNRAARLFWTVAGVAAMQKGPLWWAGHHVYHHKYADRDGVEGSPVTVVVDQKSPACLLSLHVRDLPIYDYREALRPSTRLGPPEEEEFEEEG